MPAIIVLALIAVLALAVLGMAGHVLFSPWLLMAVIAMPGSSCISAAPASCPVWPAVRVRHLTRISLVMTLQTA